MKMTTTFGALIVITSMATGCGRDEPSSSPPAGATGPAEPAPAPASESVGFIEIDGQTWTVIPGVQCGVHPGPVVSIAGYAAEDENIEIVVDYNGAEGPTGVSVINPDGSTEWNASANMTFEIERQQVKGTGNFTGTMRGSTRQAQGRFEINCP